MTDILVVINPTHDGSLDLAAAELIGAASEIGTPVALTVTAAGGLALFAGVLAGVASTASNQGSYYRHVRGPRGGRRQRCRRRP